jgi:hypothetical protein
VWIASHPFVAGVLIVLGGSLLIGALFGDFRPSLLASQATVWILIAPILVWQSRAKVRSASAQAPARASHALPASAGLPVRAGWHFADGHWICDAHARRYCKLCSQ